MSAEQNKALVRRIFEEGINQNKQGVFDELIGPSYVNHDLPAPAPGPEGFKMIIGLFLAAGHGCALVVLAREVVIRRRGPAGCATVRSAVVVDGEVEVEAAVVGDSCRRSAVTVLDVDGSAVA